MFLRKSLTNASCDGQGKTYQIQYMIALLKCLNIYSRVAEAVTVTSIDLILFLVSLYPPPVYFLQGLTDLKMPALPGILVAIFAVGSPLLTCAFQIFVYFGMTQKSNHLLSYRCILLLLLPSFFPVLFSFFQFDMAWVVSNLHFLVYIKHFLIPIDILLSSNEAKLHFRQTHSKTFDVLNVMKKSVTDFYTNYHHAITNNNAVEPYELNNV